MELMLLKDQEHVSKERASLYKQRAELEEEKHRLVEATLSLKREVPDNMPQPLATDVLTGLISSQLTF